MTLSSAEKTFANNLDPDQADILSGPYRGPDCLTLYKL